MSVTKITIPLQPVTKKNSSRIISCGGKPRLIPSKNYIEYERLCKWFLKPLSIDYPVNVQYTFYMQTKRKVDLSNLISAADDVLVKYNVLADDNRDIVAAHDGSRVLYDKQNPRTEIEITKLENYERWRK